MEQKKKHNRGSYGTVILALSLICVLVGCGSKALRGDSGAETTASPVSETVPTVTFPPVSDTTVIRTVPSSESTTDAPQTTETSAPETTTAAPDTAPPASAPAPETAASSAAPETAASTAAASAMQTSAPETAASSAAPETQASAYAPQPSADPLLTLVNRTHAVPEGWTVSRVELRGGQSVDERIYPNLQAMFDTMRAQGLSPFVREGYRTHEYQVAVMQNRINTYLSQGYSESEAKRLAEQYVAVPGTSEHELGLAVDINSTDGNSWPVYNWLAQHAHEYGFILRYPDGKNSITGINYEPWHYRYVGKENAAAIHASGLTLEEYLGS